MPATKTPPPKHRLALGDCVAVDVPDKLARVAGRFHDNGHPMLALAMRRRTAYVTALDGHWQNSVPVYRVYCPNDGWESAYREDRLTPVPMGAIPRVVCVLPDGTTGDVNYLACRPMYLIGEAETPRLPRNWTPADRAHWEAFGLARHYARNYPQFPREYWVGYPAGTCYVWKKIDPNEPLPAGGCLEPFRVDPVADVPAPA